MEDHETNRGDDIMKTKTAKLSEELRPEYDFASMEGGVRGKYTKRPHGARKTETVVSSDASAKPVTERES